MEGRSCYNTPEEEGWTPDRQECVGNGLIYHARYIFSNTKRSQEFMKGVEEIAREEQVS